MRTAMSPCQACAQNRGQRTLSPFIVSAKWSMECTCPARTLSATIFIVAKFETKPGSGPSAGRIWSHRSLRHACRRGQPMVWSGPAASTTRPSTSWSNPSVTRPAAYTSTAITSGRLCGNRRRHWRPPQDHQPNHRCDGLVGDGGDDGRANHEDQPPTPTAIAPSR